MSELLSSLQTCNSKSPGSDNTSYMFIKKLPFIRLKTLLLIYNTIWSQGFFRIQRKRSTPKLGKRKFVIVNYRLIPLVNT